MTKDQTNNLIRVVKHEGKTHQSSSCLRGDDVVDSALGYNVRGPEFQLALVVGSVGLYVQQLDGSSCGCAHSGVIVRRLMRGS